MAPLCCLHRWRSNSTRQEHDETLADSTGLMNSGETTTRTTTRRPSDARHAMAATCRLPFVNRRPASARLVVHMAAPTGRLQPLVTSRCDRRDSAKYPKPAGEQSGPIHTDHMWLLASFIYLQVALFDLRASTSRLVYVNLTGRRRRRRRRTSTQIKLSKKCVCVCVYFT